MSEQPAADTRILVVSDDVNLAALVRRELEPRGYQVKALTNAERTPLVSRVYQPDLIVLDLDASRFDPLAVTRQLHLDAVVPLLLLLAGDMENNEAVCRQLGAVDYLAKPFRPNDLATRVDWILWSAV
jgi:DNA-binding response OmpR family regulator